MRTHLTEPHEQGFTDEPKSGIGNGQRNILFIAVDQIASSTPALESIWLLITYPEITNLTLVPVYPGNQNDSTNADTSWVQLFSMRSNQTLNDDFIEAMHDRILWDNYMVIDQSDISSVLNNIKNDADGAGQQEIQASQDILSAIEGFSNTSLDNQVNLWNSVCLELSRYTGLDEIKELLHQISQDVRTNLFWNEIIQQWTVEDQGEFQIGCEFPTLTLNTH